MNTLKKTGVVSCFILLLLGCKTVNLSKTSHIYVNRSIDSTLVPKSVYVKEIAPYKKQLDSIMKQPISYAKEDFTKIGYSSNEGNLLADLLLEYSRTYAQKNNIPVPDFCLLNIGGVRTIIPKGVVTVENIFEVAPFENEMVYIQLNGSQMEEMFNYLGKEKKGHPLAGIKIIYKKEKFHSVQIGGKDFDPNKKYWVVTIDYLMNGGDRMDFFTKSQSTEVTHQRLRDILIEQIKQHKMLPESKDQRLIFEN